MSAAEFFQVLPILAAFVVIAAGLSGRRLLGGLATAVVLLAVIGRVLTLEGGSQLGPATLLLAVVLGSALSLTGTPAPSGRRLASITGAAAGLLAAVSVPARATTASATGQVLIFVLALLLAGLAWRGLLGAVTSSVGLGAAALVLLWLPWGFGDLPVGVWTGQGLVAVPGTAAAISLPVQAWTRAQTDLGSNGAQLLLVAAATWIALRPGPCSQRARWIRVAALAALALAHLGHAWILDAAPEPFAGVLLDRRTLWRADFSQLGLAAWRWLSVCALVGLGGSPPHAEGWRTQITTADLLLVAGGSGALLLGLGLADTVGPNYATDPICWVIVAVLLGAAAWRQALGIHQRLADAAASLCFACAAVLAGGAAAGWSVAGVWG